MPKILERFDRFFDTGERRREEAIAELKDAQTFFGCATYKRLRDKIENDIKRTRWKQGMSQEDASLNLMKQTVFSELLEHLDTLLREVKEKLDE